MSPIISTAISAAIIVVLIVVLIKGLIYFHNRKKHQVANEFQEHYKQVLKTSNLSLSTPELLKDSIIGLDEIHRKFLILKLADDDTYNTQVIDLEMVKNCSVRKRNNIINREGYEKNKPDAFVEEIVLELEFLDKKKPVEIIFYKHIIDNIAEMHLLEERARKWEVIITNVLRSKLRRTA